MLLVAVLAGYVLLDAWDVVPGFLTTKPAPPAPLPYPEVTAQGEPPALPGEAQASAPDKAAVQAVIDSLVASDRNTGQTVAIVADARTGEVIAQHDPDRPVTPASTMKLLTSAAALSELGPQETLPTRAEYVDGALYLVGGGDVLLAAGEGQEHETVGRAGLADLAEQAAAKLAQEGAQSVALKVDSSLFSGPEFHADVEGADRQYVMELRPLAVDRGYVEGVGFTQEPDLRAGETFAAALSERGIEVTGVERGQAPQAAEEIGRVESAPVREIVDYLLVNSDNSVAEVLGRLVGVHRGKAGSFEGGTAAVQEVLKERGIDLAGTNFADSSGLSISNKVTGKALYQVLTQVWDCKQCELASIPAGLPVGGLDGTLRNRFSGMDVVGRVRAKTGTLVQTVALAGYTRTASGYPLVFVLVDDGLEPGTARPTRGLQDEFLEELAAL